MELCIDARVRPRVRIPCNTEVYLGEPFSKNRAHVLASDCPLFLGTPKTTGKFHLKTACERVIMLIDTRSADSTELTRSEAVTTAGRTAFVERGREYEQCSGRLSERHPRLRSFYQVLTMAREGGVRTPAWGPPDFALEGVTVQLHRHGSIHGGTNS